MKTLRLLISYLALSSAIYAFNDQDLDGLSDELEIQLGLDPTRSSYFPDTDGDGFADHIEIFYRSDPKNKISHPTYGEPFWSGIDNPENFWNTVDISYSNGDWALLLGDGSVSMGYNDNVYATYTPYRPIVKVAAGYDGVFLGVQANGKAFRMDDRRNGDNIYGYQSQFRIPITPDEQVVCLNHGPVFVIRNRWKEQLRILDPYAQFTDRLDIFNNSSTKLFQADRNFLLAKTKNGIVYISQAGGGAERLELDMKWARQVYMVNDQIIGVSEAGSIYELQNWNAYTSNELDKNTNIYDNEYFDVPSLAPEDVATIEEFNGALFAVVSERGDVYRSTPTDASWQLVFSFNLPEVGSLLDPAKTQLHFTDTQAILSSCKVGQIDTSLKAIPLQNFIDETTGIAATEGVPAEFQLVYDYKNLPRVQEILGSREALVIKTKYSYDSYVGSIYTPSAEEVIFLDPNGWGLKRGSDQDGNGLDDTWEEIYHTTFGSPVDSQDNDLNGIEDAVEFFLGYDPDLPDTNGDGIPDYKDFFKHFPAQFGTTNTLNPFLNEQIARTGFLTESTASSSGFIHQSEAITTTLIQPDMNLGADTIFMEWSIMESDDLLNWNITDNFVIEKELSDGKKFFRVLMSE